MEGSTSKKIVEFDSLRIMPVPFFKNIFFPNFGVRYRYGTLIEEESELLSDDYSLVHFN